MTSDEQSAVGPGPSPGQSPGPGSGQSPGPGSGPTLVTERLLMRRWIAADREPFARLNADPEVSRYLAGPMSPADSDALVDRIEAGFDANGFGLWAVDVSATGEFAGFTGLSRPRFEAHFMPAVEVGWRLARAAWGHGYATEAARAALDYGFGPAGLDEIVSFTTRTNGRSRAVMDRLGMTHDPADDFDHPMLATNDPLRRHVLYRLTRTDWLTTRC
jgi:RimJ/RimL family protein N-acetyltransferase